MNEQPASELNTPGTTVNAAAVEDSIRLGNDKWVKRYAKSFSFLGLFVGSLFFAASVTPSLLPRTFLVQGVLSGLSLAIGYGVGVAAVSLWRFLEFPALNLRLARIAKLLAVICSAYVVITFLWRSTQWQNSIRGLMEMPDVETAYPMRLAVVAVVFACVLIALARCLHWCFLLVAKYLNRLMPRRVAAIVSSLVVGVLLLLVVNGVFAKQALRLADEFFLRTDGLIDDDIEQPTSRLASGSDASLIPWDGIGRRGKNFIAAGPTKEQISEFSETDAMRPLRVYVGLRAADTPKARAQLALDELKRVDAFSRSVLVVATPTGTGWLDPNSVDPIEYLHAGDTAIVSMQYSYLPSWMTIIVDPQRSKVAARTLFQTVYDHWKTLPRDARPKLYLQGLSLGSLGSEVSADLLTTFEDPIQGAVWSGPPFPSSNWSQLTRARNEDSPAWLPTFRDGSVIRFTAQENALPNQGDRWSKMRIVYIQHASDPMVFFSPDLLFSKPAWLTGKRGPDVSPDLTWYPIITFLQVALDLPLATSVPNGFGHNYATSSYIDAWLEVTDPKSWSPEQTAKLKRLFASSDLTNAT